MTDYRITYLGRPRRRHVLFLDCPKRHRVAVSSDCDLTGLEFAMCDVCKTDAVFTVNEVKVA